MHPVPSLALIQCHLVVPIYVLQCSNPGAEQAPFSHSGTFLFKDPAVDCPTGQQEMSFNCALHTERKIGPASKLHVSFPYPLSIPISMCRQHIHIHNISIHIHEPCPDFRPQDQVPPNNPIGIQGEAGKEITAVYQLLVDRPTQLICISDIYLSTDKYKRHSRAIC